MIDQDEINLLVADLYSIVRRAVILIRQLQGRAELAEYRADQSGADLAARIGRR